MLTTLSIFALLTETSVKVSILIKVVTVVEAARSVNAVTEATFFIALGMHNGSQNSGESKLDHVESRCAIGVFI